MQQKWNVGCIRKYIFDKVLSFVLIILLFPILIFISLLIVLTMKSNPIFFQKRIGKGGKEFYIYKFKTMVDNSEEVLANYLYNNPLARMEYAKYHKLKNDPRVTPIGKFLRRTSLDELPQLFNILKGEMSFVGPRPILPEEKKKFGKFFHIYTSVKPGLTGLWQVSGRNELSFEKRIKLDIFYVRNWSFSLDLMIFLKTIVIVLRRQGSY